MAYPVVDKPYGFKPINLIGGQVFAGSTRSLPIEYNYSTAIYFGDAVVLTKGFITRVSVGASTGSNLITGVFLGCSYTSPATGQKIYSQYYPASTAAGDIVAIVADDPDTVYKAVVCSSGTTVASGALAMVGTNLSGINNTGSNVTGNSANAILAPTATPVSTILPFRCVGVVPETAVTLGTATYSSIATATITTSANVGFAVPVGTHVAWLNSTTNQLVNTGSFVATAITANNTTSVVLNAAPTQTISASSTLVFVQYPEILVKWNVLSHGYYSSVTA